MLLISTRLGLIACRYLAEAYYQEKWITAQEIATHYNVNVRSLMSALNKMVRAGILRSNVGGANPGFLFVKAPTDIMLSEVWTALEGTLSMPCCKELIEGLNCDCDDTKECRSHALFSDIIKEANLRLATTSIAGHTGIDIQKMKKKTYRDSNKNENEN